MVRDLDVKFEVPGFLELGKSWDHQPTQFGYLKLIVMPPCTSAARCGFTPGLRIDVYPGGLLELADGYINSHTRIECFTKISIGSDATIAEGVVIRDSDSHVMDGKPEKAPIKIGDHVWIGMGATIFKGGDHRRRCGRRRRGQWCGDVPPITLWAAYRPG